MLNETSLPLISFIRKKKEKEKKDLIITKTITLKMTQVPQVNKGNHKITIIQSKHNIEVFGTARY